MFGVWAILLQKIACDEVLRDNSFNLPDSYKCKSGIYVQLYFAEMQQTH